MLLSHSCKLLSLLVMNSNFNVNTLRVDLILADVRYFLKGNVLIEMFNYIFRKKIC